MELVYALLTMALLVVCVISGGIYLATRSIPKVEEPSARYKTVLKRPALAWKKQYITVRNNDE